MSVQQVQLELDSNVRRTSNGTALLGGSPFRVIRLSSAGAQMLDGWLLGDETPASSAAAALRDRLVAAGMVHPVPATDVALPSFAIVVPVLNDVTGLARLIGALAGRGTGAPDGHLIVVDDGSVPPINVSAETLRHESNRGPAASRNTGWRRAVETGAEIVVFLDADVTPEPDSLALLLAHFVDPNVAAVAPRVRSEPGSGPIADYESTNSPLDMGADAAIAVSGSRLSYVPSAALAVRASVLTEMDGFDESLRYGEDVDLVWRLGDSGYLVRYEPRAVVHHRNRPTLAALARQRFGYGSAAADLAAQHGDKVAPLQLPANVVVPTVAFVVGGPRLKLVSLAAAAAGSLPLRNKLAGKVDAVPLETARLSLLSHGYALQGLAAAATRTWAPLLMMSKRTRRSLLAAIVVPSLVEWFRRRPANDPLTHTALRAADHASYCAGVWSGVLRRRSIAALLPAVRTAQRNKSSNV